jgi:transketolase
MRRTIAKQILEMMDKDDRIIVLVGDLGFGVFDQLRLKYPKRVINCGIAEQNMVGVAAGLALGGKLPIVYSIAPFVSTRVLEQIKIDLCQQNAKAIVIGTGAGFAYGNLGPTHHCLEDFAALSCMPNLTLYQPYDKQSAHSCFGDAVENNDGPSYIRLGSDGIDLTDFVTRHEAQSDTMVMSTGTITEKAILSIEKMSLDWRFICRFNNRSRKKLYNIIKPYKNIITLEESYLRGGFGSMIAETVVDNQMSTRVLRIGVESRFAKSGGTSNQIRERFGLEEEAIKNRIEEFLIGKN